jgi:hypothetical protein
MLAAIMHEPASYTENGVEYVGTRLELLVRTITIAAAKGNLKARSLHEQLSGHCERAGQVLPMGVLITQGKMSQDEWVAKYGGSQDS